MSEWIKFVPSKDHIGLRARFRKVIGDEVEEVVGTIVADPCHNPWQYDVEIICDDDKRRLPFPNGLCPFYDDKDGERHYIGDSFEVEYYYSPEDKPLCREGYSAMVIDELTTIRNGRLEEICRSGGKSYAKAGAVVGMLFNDADHIVEGVRKVCPRLLADQLKRENERLKSIFDGKSRETSPKPGDKT